jgi:homoserine O-succinyltransferase
MQKILSLTLNKHWKINKETSMPVIIPQGIPAFAALQVERVFVMSHERATTQDIRPVNIAILNLMPTKIETETQLLRLLSNSLLQVNVTFIKTASYKSKNVSEEHLDKFYVEFDTVKDKKFDGMIITGAPVELMQFNEVQYYEELTRILDFAKTNVTSTVFICWGAQVALNHYYGINKVELGAKISGVFPHKKVIENEPLLSGIDETFYIPHSRYTGLDEKAVAECRAIQVLAFGEQSKSSIIKSKDNRFFFLTGHSEYDAETLDKEYRRDISKGLDIAEPANYYVNGQPQSRWKAAASVLFQNWLNHYVYQVTPFQHN